MTQKVVIENLWSKIDITIYKKYDMWYNIKYSADS